MRQTRSPRIWVELDDLIRYFDHHITPTGIGRVQLEIVPELLRLYPDRVGVIRIGKDPDDVRVIRPERLASLIDTAKILERRREQAAVVNGFDAVVRYVRRQARALRDRWFVSAQERKAFTDTVKNGDVILALGGSWTHSNFGRSLRTLKARHGLKFALLIHDILPLSTLNLCLRAICQISSNGCTT